MSKRCRENSDLPPRAVGFLWTQRGPEDLERNRCDVIPAFLAWSVVLPSVAKVSIAAFSNVLLPLWLCVVFTAYMFGPVSLGLCVGSLDS